MSKIQWSTLSSLAAGALLSAVLGSTGTCSAGYAAVRVSLMWFGHLANTCLLPLYRVRPQRYSENNAEFVLQASASSAPRTYVSKDPTVVHVAMLTALLGISDALAVGLPHTRGDAFVLTCVAFYIAHGVWRKVAILAVLYTTATNGLPGAHDLVRGMSITMGMACSVMHLPWTHQVARVVISIILVWQMAYGPCTNGIRAVPISVLMSLSIHKLQAPPVALLIIAAVAL